jgi:V/A-type H+-transporting ATPase subunit A
VQENEVVEHRIMVPPGLVGEIVAIESGSYTVTDVVAKVRRADGAEQEIAMLQRWPVRIPRPYAKKVAASEPLVTGTRVIDTMFPLAKGGAACIPGPFGAGKTVTQHQVAKWSNADIVIFIGCGERGNEMTDVLMEFPELVDPYSGQPLMRRTVLDNTSNMVAARGRRLHRITMESTLRHGLRGRVQAETDVALAERRAISLPPREMPGEELSGVPGHGSPPSTRAGKVEARVVGVSAGPRAPQPSSAPATTRGAAARATDLLRVARGCPGTRVWSPVGLASRRRSVELVGRTRCAS